MTSAAIGVYSKYYEKLGKNWLGRREAVGGLGAWRSRHFEIDFLWFGVKEKGIGHM